MKNNPRDDEFRKMREEIYAHPETILDTQEAADSIFYSYRWFVVCWKCLFSVSYKEDCDKARSEYIKRGLRKWKRIPVIAEELRLSESAVKRTFIRVNGITIKKYIAQEVGL